MTNTFATLRLLPMSDRDKDTEILAPRHQLAIPQRQLDPARARSTPANRAFLTALLQPLSRASLHQPPLIISPDTLLRRHLVRAEPSGREARYGVEPEQFDRALAQLAAVSQVWDRRLRRVEEIAESISHGIRPQDPPAS